MADVQEQRTGKVGEADLIFHGGRIYTVDAKRSWSQAVAVRDGKIVAIGSDADLLKWRGDATETHDLAGRMMMPGLVDVHNHHTRGGEMDLYDVTFQAYHSFDEILSLVKARAENCRPVNGFAAASGAAS
jgi:predicted amidohydrolase YtcJ